MPLPIYVQTTTITIPVLSLQGDSESTSLPEASHVLCPREVPTQLGDTSGDSQVPLRHLKWDTNHDSQDLGSFSLEWDEMVSGVSRPPILV